MKDITKCANDTCPAREKCYRFTCPNDYPQSYASFKYKVASKNKDGAGVKCDWFIPEEVE